MASSQEINIPQKPPFVMVDRLVSVTEGWIETSFDIREENILCDHGVFTEAGLIENMAQSAAAGTGARPGIKSGKPPIGFIGGIRHLNIHKHPRCGDTIRTTIEIEHEIMDASVVAGKVWLDQQLMAECQLKIFLIQ
jgi:3-hydroxyacyl-[acyl-carrier-protein] dehydratase